VKTRLFVITTLLLLAVLFPATAVYAAADTKDVEKELMCQCGCTMVVDVCDCGTADQMREKIAGMISDGQDKGSIVAYFVDQYGEKVLATPTKQGFNLVAWIGPFVAVLAGGTGLFFLLRAWSRKGKEPNDETIDEERAVPVAAAETNTYRSQLETELQRFREEGTP